MDIENQYDADDERDWDDIPEESEILRKTESQQEEVDSSVTGDDHNPDEHEINVQTDQTSVCEHNALSNNSCKETTIGSIDKKKRERNATKLQKHVTTRREKPRRPTRPQRKVLNIRGDRFGVTPLHIAVERRSVDLVKLLIRAGANVDAQDLTGRSPLHLACEMERMDLVQALLGMRLSRAKPSSPRRRGLPKIQRGRIGQNRSTKRRPQRRRAGRRPPSISSISSVSSQSLY